MLLFKATFRYNIEVLRTLLQSKHTAEAAILTLDKLLALYQQLSLNIQFLNKQIAYYADQYRSQKLLFKKGDKMYLLCKNLKTKYKLDKLD